MSVDRKSMTPSTFRRASKGGLDRIRISYVLHRPSRSPIEYNQNQIKPRKVAWLRPRGRDSAISVGIKSNPTPSAFPHDRGFMRCQSVSLRWTDAAVNTLSEQQTRARQRMSPPSGSSWMSWNPRHPRHPDLEDLVIRVHQAFPTHEN
jgi:hypothetical protein